MISHVAWTAMIITMSLTIIVCSIVYNLSQYYHVFGTDKVGQDVLYQAIKSIRTGLVIGTLTTLVMLPFAIMMGLMAGYFRGWIDDVIQYLYTTLNSIPVYYLLRPLSYYYKFISVIMPMILIALKKEQI